MTGEEIAAPVLDTPGRMTKENPSDRNPTRLAPLRKGTKLFSVLAELARGISLNRFEAYRDLHDSVLNSTVAEIQKRGIVVARKEETVNGYRGSTVHCCRYWLEPEERAKAAALLGWRP